MKLKLLIILLGISTLSFGQNEFGIGTGFVRVLGEVEDLGIKLNKLHTEYKYKVHENAWLHFGLELARTEGLDVNRSHHPSVIRSGNLREIDYQAYANSLGNHVHFQTDFVFFNIGSSINPLAYVNYFDKSNFKNILSLEYNVGVFYHNTKIDIFDQNNNIYSLSSPFGIGTVGRESILENRDRVYREVYDQDFETTFSVDNRNLKWFVSAGLGINLPISENISLNFSSRFYFQSSDYLDALRNSRPENVNQKSISDGIQSFNMVIFYKI